MPYSKPSRKIRASAKMPVLPTMASVIRCSSAALSKPIQANRLPNNRTSLNSHLEIKLWQPLLEFYVDAKRPVLITQSHKRNRPRDVVLYLDHLLLRRTHIGHIGDRQIWCHLLLYCDARRSVLART